MNEHNVHRSDAHGWPGDDVAVPPHGLDLDTIVRVGRRQVRHRRMAMVGGTAAVLVAVAAIPAAVPLRPTDRGGDAGQTPATGVPLVPLDCDVMELPLPAEYAEPEPDVFPDVNVAAMDPTGRYVVANGPYEWTTEPDGSESVTTYEPNGMVLWEDGRPTALAPLRGGGWASDVNADGVVVGGGADQPPPDGYAWVYSGGEMSELPTPDGYDSAEAVAINAAGDVVGTASRNDGLHTVVEWPADDPDNPRLLTGPEGSDVVAKGITDDGLVVGEGSIMEMEASLLTTVYLWEPDGTRHELPVPEGAIQPHVTAVRGTWAVGYTGLAPAGTATPPPSPAPPREDSMVSLRWDLSFRTVRLVDAGGSAPNLASDVTAAGDVLFSETPAMLSGELFGLPDPIDEGAVFPPDTANSPNVSARAISDNATAVAGTVFINDTPDRITHAIHPVIWHC